MTRHTCPGWLRCPVLPSVTISCPRSAAGQLMGMNEIAEKLTLDAKCRNEHAIVQRVTAAANLSRVPCGSDRECR